MENTVNTMHSTIKKRKENSQVDLIVEKIPYSRDLSPKSRTSSFGGQLG